MQTFNFFENQFVGVNDMMALQSVPQSAIKDILVSLANKGVISGVQVTPTTPTNSLAVVVSMGKLILEDGSDVTTGTTTTIDLSSYVTGLSAGQSAWASIYAVPTQISDTPIVTPAGDTINYRTYDAVAFLIVLGTPANSAPNKTSNTPPGYTGVLIADVLLTSGQTAISGVNIDQTRLNSFINIPYILGLIQSNNPPWPISNITGLSAALAQLMPLTYQMPTSQVVGLDSQLNVLTTGLAAINAALSSDMTQINTTLAQHQSSISTLQSQMGTANANITNLTNISASLSATATFHANSISTLNGEVSTINGQISTINNEIATLNNEAATFVTLSRFAHGSTGSGYWELGPTGKIENWGQVNFDLNSSSSFITFPKPYTNLGTISVIVTTQSGVDRITFIVNNATLTGFTIENNGSGGYANWFAIGY